MHVCKWIKLLLRPERQTAETEYGTFQGYFICEGVVIRTYNVWDVFWRCLGFRLGRIEREHTDGIVMAMEMKPSSHTMGWKRTFSWAATSFCFRSRLSAAVHWLGEKNLSLSRLRDFIGGLVWSGFCLPHFCSIARKVTTATAALQ